MTEKEQTYRNDVWNESECLISFYHQGGSEARAKAARRIVDGGVAVMGHVGLTPQAIRYV